MVHAPKIIVGIIIFTSVFALIGCGTTETPTTTTTTTTTATGSTTTTLHTQNKADEAKNNLVFSSLTFFPVDLDTLFNPPGGLNDIQQNIKNGGALASQQSLLISPLMQHFGTSHPEGTGKWYIYTQTRRLAVRAPAKGIIINQDLGSQAYWETKQTEVISNETVYNNCRITLYLDKNKSIRFDHIDALVSLIQNVFASTEGYIIVNAGDGIGYTSATSGLDFLMEDTGASNSISEGKREHGSTYIGYRTCPLSYFTSELQSQITTYYNNVMYAPMKEGGKWPESLIDTPVNVNITGEVWGTWYYKSGDLGLSTQESWFHFDKGILVFLAKSKTNPETFFMDLTADSTTSLETICPNLAGLYTQITYSDQSYLVLEKGNNVEGIFSRRGFGDGTIKNYINFAVDLKTSSLYDDELKVKFFNSSSEAQADPMTQDIITYVKDDEKASPQNY